MILALGVLLDVLPVEVDVAQIAGAVALRLIAEVRRRRIAALAAGRDRLRAHAIAELDRRDEAVAGGAVHLLRAVVGPRPERGERTPPRRGEAHGDARLAVVERLHEGAVDPLVAVDRTPWRLPAAEVRFEPAHRTGERLHELLGRALGRRAVVGRHPRPPRILGDAASDVLA